FMKFCAVLLHGFNNGFYCLLSHFLRNFSNACFKKFGGVGSFRRLQAALTYNARKFFQKIARSVALFPTSVGSGMANGTFGLNKNQNGIVVAINFRLNEFQKITRFLTFGPKAVFASAEKSNFSGIVCLLPGFGIHVAQHQNFSGLNILNN